MNYNWAEPCAPHRKRFCRLCVSRLAFYCTGCNSRTEGVHSAGCPAG